LEACKKYKVAPIVSFSITGLGGSSIEAGVMKYQDLLERIGRLIHDGVLNAVTTTIRIDPILPGATDIEDIKKIVQIAKSFGIKKFVTSLVQSYGYLDGTPRDRKITSGINNALAKEGKSYNWDEYYGRDKLGRINFKPKQKYIDEIGNTLIELDKDPEITIQTCAFIIKGLKASACLDPLIIERLVGVDITRADGSYDRDTSRPDCMCYGCHSDLFEINEKKCYSSCAYCYASHSGDNNLNYYNEDGTLKDNAYTRTERNSNNSTEKINIYAGTGENADLSNFAERPLNFGKTTAYSIPEGATSGAFKSKYPIYDIGKVTYSTKENPDYGESFVFDGLSDLFSGCRFKTVEGAFQAAKLVFTHPKGNGAKGNKYWQPKEYTQRENSIDGVYYNTATTFVLTDEGKQLLQKFQEASGTQARSLGRQIEGLNRQEWDANSSKIMKAVIGRSFEDNQQALQRLLATGNATLTHTQDKGKWGTEFPKLLMEVRDELRKEHPQV
jgi:predicted NAD-dependent protein-ADP-ribosyltransferase YbiA (DUF1768 family)